MAKKNETYNNYVERDNLPCGKIIAHDKRYILKVLDLVKKTIILKTKVER